MNCCGGNKEGEFGGQTCEEMHEKPSQKLGKYVIGALLLIVLLGGYLILFLR